MNIEVVDNTKEKILCEYCQKNCFVYVNGVKVYCDVYKNKYIEKTISSIDAWKEYKK